MEDKEKKKLLKVLKGSRLCRRLGEKEIKSLLEQKGNDKDFFQRRKNLSGDGPAGCSLYAS